MRSPHCWLGVPIFLLTISWTAGADSSRHPHPEWTHVAKGYHSSSHDRDAYRLRFDYENCDYDLRVVHQSTGRFSVKLYDSRGYALTEETGRREVTIVVAAADTGRRVRLIVESEGAIGRYDVYYRALRRPDGPWDGPGYYQENIAGTYAVEYPRSRASRGECVIHQQGPYVRIQGRTYFHGRLKNHWTGTGEWDGYRLFFQWESSTGERGTVEAYLTARGTLSGTYTVTGGTGATVKYHPRGFGQSLPPVLDSPTPPTSGNDPPPYTNSSAAGITGTYTVSYVDGTHGTIHITQRGRFVEISGSTYSPQNRLISTWTGQGTFDGRRLQFRWRSSNGRTGTNTMTRQRDGSLVGTFTIDGTAQSGSEVFRPVGPPVAPTSPRQR